MTEDDSAPVVRNASRHRFEVEGQPSAFLLYAESHGRIRLIHTEVSKAFRGRGYASALAKGALEYAREQHLRVEPACPFVRDYLGRHPEYADLVQPGEHLHSPEEERRIREASLDETLAETFPASDPLSTDPNPGEQ